jgi:hypothetical protein
MPRRIRIYIILILAVLLVLAVLAGLAIIRVQNAGTF